MIAARVGGLLPENDVLLLKSGAGVVEPHPDDSGARPIGPRFGECRKDEARSREIRVQYEVEETALPARRDRRRAGERF